MALDTLDGATVTLAVGQTLNITTGTQPADVFTGDVENPDVAMFTPGSVTAGQVSNPGVLALKAGSSMIVLTNSQDGSQPVTFTITVE